MRRCGVSEVIGSWKIIAMRWPRSATRAAAEQVDALEPRAAGDTRLSRQQAHHREESLSLAGAGLADDAEAAARRDLEARVPLRPVLAP